MRSLVAICPRASVTTWWATPATPATSVVGGGGGGGAGVPHQCPPTTTDIANADTPAMRAVWIMRMMLSIFNLSTPPCRRREAWIAPTSSRSRNNSDSRPKTPAKRGDQQSVTGHGVRSNLRSNHGQGSLAGRPGCRAGPDRRRSRARTFRYATTVRSPNSGYAPWQHTSGPGYPTGPLWISSPASASGLGAAKLYRHVPAAPGGSRSGIVTAPSGRAPDGRRCRGGPRLRGPSRSASTHRSHRVSSRSRYTSARSVRLL